MSFSAQVKDELCGHIASSRHCRMAELGAMTVMSGSFTGDKWEPDTENQLVKLKSDKLLRLLEIDINTEDGKKALKLKAIRNRYVVDPLLVERSCCKQAYIRGAFIATGSITNPEKGYHFEIVCDIKKQAELLMDIISDFGLEPKLVLRKKYYVVYLKDASMIVDILNIMGAHISLMNMENVRILKDMRNSVNRRVNCETANINKTVSAAVKQIEDIRYIESKKGLKYLPDNLRLVAELRLEEPDMPLKDLGEHLQPPLGKSGVNHRLRKISEMANELRRN